MMNILLEFGDTMGGKKLEQLTMIRKVGEGFLT